MLSVFLVKYNLYLKKSILLFSFILIAYTCFAQKATNYSGFYDIVNSEYGSDSSCKIYISKINIYGNKRTKDYVILREMKIKEGDSIMTTSLYDLITESRNLVYNTNLFYEVNFQPVLSSAFTVIININIIERWYIYPSPQFKLIDRNINEWWKVYNADLERVIYGIKFSHFNLSGRGDQLNLFLLNGYSRNFSFNYFAPYSNTKLTEGFSIGAGYNESRSFPYKSTYNNEFLEFKKSSFEKKTFFVNASYSKRKGYFSKHIFFAQYSFINVNDSVISEKYNPNYFNLSKSKLSIPDLSYVYQYINVDNINYPNKGKTFSFSFFKRGLGLTEGINMLSLDFKYRKYIPHPKKFFSSIALMGKLKLPFEQAYINQRAMGYGDFSLQGLEYYAIDGVAASIAKYTLGKKLISFKIPVPFKIKAIPYIPFSFYGKTYFNTGFCYNKKEFDTRLNNRLLYTGGFGLDILSLYDLKFSMEFSFNQLGEKGLFLHASGNF